MLLRCAVLGLGLLCFVAPGSAAPKAFVQVLGSEYREQLDPPVPVSGLALVGLALSGPIDLDAKILHVFLTKPFDGRLSLEMTSADGRFRAQGLYEGKSDGNEWVALQISPRAGDQAREYLKKNQTELAVAVRPVTRTGNTALDQVFQVTWGRQPESGLDRTLRLHVNSRRGDMSVRVLGDTTAGVCKALRIATAVRFDTVCEVPWRSSGAGAPDLQLIRRDGFDESLQRVQLR